MRKLNPYEMVVLNPLQTGRDLFSPKVLVPRYVATNDGIYRVNTAKRMMRGYPVVLGFIMGIAVLVFITIIGIGLLVDSALYISFNNDLIDWILALFGFGMTVGSVYGIIKLVKIRKKVERIANDIEGELVVPWSHVKSIVVMNVRQENFGTTINPIYKLIGDWHVLTIDGRDIIIPFVDDPYNKLEYVKKKFDLYFN